MFLTCYKEDSILYSITNGKDEDAIRLIGKVYAKEEDAVEILNDLKSKQQKGSSDVTLG